jgi:hypothetical protein
MPLGVHHSRLRDPLRQQATPQFGNFDRFSDSASGAFRCAQPNAAMDGWMDRRRLAPPRVRSGSARWSALVLIVSAACLFVCSLYPELLVGSVGKGLT